MEAHMGSEDTTKVTCFTWLLAREGYLTQEKLEKEKYFSVF